MIEAPADVLEILRSCHVDSHEKLDVLVFVSTREAPAHMHEIAASACMTIADAERTVAALCSRRILIMHEARQVSRTTDAALRVRIDELLRAYYACPLSLLCSLWNQKLDRLRTSARRLRR